MPWKLGNKVIKEGRGWTDDSGIKHPQNWASCWSDADKKSFGLIWEDPPAAFDSRFYWDADTAKSLDDVTNSDGTVTTGLKTQWVTATKQTANSLLSSSDWYVTRKTESNQAIPDAIQDYRTAVRVKCAEIETAINDATSVENFAKLFEPVGDTPAVVHNWPAAPSGA